MPSIDYENVYSRFLTKVEAYDLIGEDDDIREEFLCNWLHAAVFNPYVRKLFSSISLDDDMGVITYQMLYNIDPAVDEEFVTEVLAYGIMYGWVEPKVNSLTTMAQLVGTSDEKFYSQAAHLAELRGLRDDADKKLRTLIRDRGYLNNTYLDAAT